MSATTIGAVFDRINSVVAGQNFVQAVDPFDFELQPAGKLDNTFIVKTDRTDSVGYFGGAQGEIHLVEVWVAKKFNRNPHGAVRQLKSDLDIIEATLYEDYFAYDYYIDDASVRNECQLPGPNDSYCIGRLQFTVDFDRVPE